MPDLGGSFVILSLEMAGLKILFGPREQSLARVQAIILVEKGYCSHGSIH